MDLENQYTDEVVQILYTNYRGERAWRCIRPLKIWFGETNWHPERQWLLDAIDLERNAERSFAIRDIKSWLPKATVSLNASTEIDR